jgi:hypothetical protein
MNMVLALTIAAVLEVLFGFSVFVASKSAVHEILAILCFGFSALTFGLARIISELEGHRRPAQEEAPATATATAS